MQRGNLNHYSLYYPSLWDVLEWSKSREVYVVSWEPLKQRSQFNSIVIRLYNDHQYMLIYTRYTDEFIRKQVCVFDRAEFDCFIASVDDVLAGFNGSVSADAMISRFIFYGNRFSRNDQEKEIGRALFESMFCVAVINDQRVRVVSDWGDNVNSFDSLLSHNVLGRINFGTVY